MPDDTVTDLGQTVVELRRELDARTAERDEALAREAAASEVLQVINSSPGDLVPVFDAMLEKAMRLCDAVFGELRTYDGERFHLAAIRGVPAAYADYYKNHDSGSYGPGTGPARILAGEAVVHVPDLLATGPYRRGDPDRRALVHLGGARAILLVPLVKDGAVLGFIMIYRQEPRPFSDKQIALLQNFAAQAVIAMENARLLTETREALAQQTATGEILGVISRSPTDIRPVFEAIVENASRLCEAEFSAVARLEGGLLHLVALNNMSPEEAAAFHSLFPRRPGRRFAMGRALVDARPVHIDDVLTDLDYDPRTLEVLQSVARYRSFLAVPIFREGRPVGVVGCGWREFKPFTATQIDLVKTFADQAAIAIENIRLFEELETRNRDLGEALEQQTATAEVLQVINSSPGNLAPVFDAMLDKALGLCGAAFGVLWTYDGERVHAAALRGVPPEFAEFLTRAPHPVGPDNAHGRLLRGEPVVHIADVAEDKAYRSGDPIRRTLVELGAGRTLLAVPLRKDGRVYW
jgi:GAF domain-containing protein